MTNFSLLTALGRLFTITRVAQATNGFDSSELYRRTAPQSCGFFVPALWRVVRGGVFAGFRTRSCQPAHNFATQLFDSSCGEVPKIVKGAFIMNNLNPSAVSGRPICNF